MDPSYLIHQCWPDSVNVSGASSIQAMTSLIMRITLLTPEISQNYTVIKNHKFFYLFIVLVLVPDRTIKNVFCISAFAGQLHYLVFHLIQLNLDRKPCVFLLSMKKLNIFSIFLSIKRWKKSVCTTYNVKTLLKIKNELKYCKNSNGF